MNYIKRNLEKVVSQVTKEYPVVLVTRIWYLSPLNYDIVPSWETIEERRLPLFYRSEEPS